MKMFYRQLLAFFAVMLTLMVILSVSFAHSTTNMLYRKTWSQLTTDADSLIQDSIQYDVSNSSFKGFAAQSLMSNANLLARQHVHFAIYKPQKNKYYTSNDFSPRISHADWRQLKAGKTIHRKIDYPAVSRKPNGDVKSKANRNLPMTEIIRPYFSKHRLIAVVAAGTFVSTINDSKRQTMVNLMWSTALAVVCALILGYLLSHQLTDRLSKMQKAARSIARGDYDVHVETKTNDEIDDLGRDFNQMAESLKASREEIHKQEERRERFMADAAHEMRTPLTTINGILEGLAYDAIPEEDKAHSIKLMQDDTARLIRLVNNTLDSEKIRTNQITLNRKEFDATAEIKELCEQLKQKAADKDDQLQVDSPQMVDVYADYDRFVQVMFNIITNAIQFTEHGLITVSASRLAHGAEFKVADTGIGMSKDQLHQIWDRFYKADRSRMNTQYGESGIGLSIVRQLMKLHGGKIDVASKPGKGSTFTIFFPDRDYAPQGNVDSSADQDQDN